MESLKKTGVVIQGFDILDVTKFIAKSNKKHQAILLAQLEDEIKDKELFTKVRKLVLDSLNNQARSTINTIFGDIET
jgi:hypothetical protein